MLCLILDSRYASQYAAEALELCLKTVIPSLFPMFVLSGMLVASLSGTRNRFIAKLEKQLLLPVGGGPIFLLGAVGGFPIGAQCMVQAMEQGSLSKQNAERMLGFCNNCSPAFLFGILGSIFASPVAPLLIFLIQLEAAMMTALFWPCYDGQVRGSSGSGISLPMAVSRAVRSMVSVCAWVILAGVVTGFLGRWLFPLVPSPVPEIAAGLLEITGGVLGLRTIESEALRFFLCNVFVCFGGVSVLLQIQSIAGEQGLSIEFCIRQKLTQAVLGGILSASVTAMGPACLLLPVIFISLWKKAVEIPRKAVYNSSRKGGI